MLGEAAKHIECKDTLHPIGRHHLCLSHPHTPNSLTDDVHSAPEADASLNNPSPTCVQPTDIEHTSAHPDAYSSFHSSISYTLLVVRRRPKSIGAPNKRCRIGSHFVLRIYQGILTHAAVCVRECCKDATHIFEQYVNEGRHGQPEKFISHKESVSRSWWVLGDG